jgi:hypothetical protein
VVIAPEAIPPQAGSLVPIVDVTAPRCLAGDGSCAEGDGNACNPGACRVSLANHVAARAHNEGSAR